MVFSARCPKCGNRTFDPPAQLDVALDFGCDACGHHSKLVEFADLDTLDAIAQNLKKRVLQTLKNTNYRVKEIQ
jgi:hypothetical protein